MELKIGDVTLENQIIVGPMAGISNQSFRSVMKEFGAGLVVSEMISDKAIYYQSRKTFRMCEIGEDEHPMALQLFGCDIDTMVHGAKYFDEQTSCDIIDINMGCPVRKVVANNGGSALMKDPQHAYEIVKAIKENVRKPVTVKLRAGWDLEHVNVVEMAVMMQKAGADGLTIHPRTRTQFYEGHSNWDLIRQVKEAVRDIPVIGNGDIKKVEDMIEMEKQTGCDGFMVARGCLGNPWLIRQMVHYQQTGEVLEDPSCQEKMDQCLYHADKLIALKGEKNAIKEMRGHACWYLNGMAKANKVKAKINHIDTRAQLDEIIAEYLKALETEDFSYFEEN